MNEQHFLVEKTKLRSLVEALALEPGERVLELGAGIGSVAAALPAEVRLTLVEKDERLAEGLRGRFPAARVIAGDALAHLPELAFDVLLSNLPHALSDDVLARLAVKPFRRAAVAVREGHPREAFSSFGARLLAVLEGGDFSPRQPFDSELWLLEPRLLEPIRKPAPKDWSGGGADGI